MTTSLTGHCLCGAVSSTAAAEPVLQAICHCDDCKRGAGSTFATFLGVPRGSLPGGPLAEC